MKLLSVSSEFVSVDALFSFDGFPTVHIVRVLTFHFTHWLRSSFFNIHCPIFGRCAYDIYIARIDWFYYLCPSVYPFIMGNNLRCKLYPLSSPSPRLTSCSPSSVVSSRLPLKPPSLPPYLFLFIRNIHAYGFIVHPNVSPKTERIRINSSKKRGEKMK